MLDIARRTLSYRIILMSGVQLDVMFTACVSIYLLCCTYPTGKRRLVTWPADDALKMLPARHAEAELYCLGFIELFVHLLSNCFTVPIAYWLTFLLVFVIHKWCKQDQILKTKTKTNTAA